MYASFLRISRALHLDVFEQPEENHFFNNLLDTIAPACHPACPQPREEASRFSSLPFPELKNI
jgi:hypothetical protein